MKSLNDNSSNTNNRDGMDMSLCKLNFKKKTLEFAGANNPLIHISDNQLENIKGN